MKAMSLSMVLGMLITLMERPRRSASTADIVRAARGAVAADAEYEVDVHAREGFDHDLGALLAARGAEDGAALLVDVVGVVLVELDRSESVRRVEAPVTVPDAVDQRHMVDVLERQRQELDHSLSPGQSPPAVRIAALLQAGSW